MVAIYCCSEKTSGSRIHYMYSNSGYTMSPCVVHSSSAAVRYRPQKTPNCKIVDVCTLCVYTLCVHYIVYASSCTSNRILPNLGRNCKIVGVCIVRMYTQCVHCTVYTSSCTFNRILPNLDRFLLAGAYASETVE